MLLDNGWGAPAPDEWVQPDGTHWRFQPGTNCREFLDTFGEHLKAGLRRRTASFRNGKGLELGADLSTLKRHCARLERQGLPGHAQLLACVASGAAWTEERRAQAGYTTSSMCPRCGRAEESDYHRTWACVANVDEGGSSTFARTACLQKEAEDGHAGNPALWCTGHPRGPS